MCLCKYDFDEIVNITSTIHELIVINTSIAENLDLIDDPDSPISNIFEKKSESKATPLSDRFCEWRSVKC